MQRLIKELADDATAKETIIWLRHVAEVIGPGFHPDTPATEYVRLSDDVALFTTEEAIRLDADLQRSFRIMETVGRDPYTVCGRVQRRQLGMPFPS